MLGLECAHPYRCANPLALRESHAYQSHMHKHVSRTARLQQQRHKRHMQQTQCAIAQTRATHRGKSTRHKRQNVQQHTAGTECNSTENSATQKA